MTIDREWYSAGIKDSGSKEEETLVSPWEPGDGVLCSHNGAGGSRTVRCERPVAISRQVWTAKNPRWEHERIPRVIRRTLCAEHLANLFTEKTTTGERSENRQKAIEEVIANHHPEFMDALDRLTAEGKENRLESLPEPLRTEVKDRLSEREDES